MNKIIQEDVQNILSEELPWSKVEGKRILISGASGLLPSYMTEVFLKLGCKVVALVRDQEKAKMRFQSYTDTRNLEILKADLALPLSVSGSFDYIIHGASPASPSFYGKDPIGTLAPNVLGTMELLKIAKKSESQGFLYFSSSEVYGQVSSQQIPTKETDFGSLDPNQVRSCYGEGKRMGETICKAWNHQMQVPTFAVRPFHTYGPSMALNDGRVFSDFVGNIVSGKNIVLKSDGLATRSYCYAEDAVRGFFTVLLKGTAGEAYNVGNDSAEISVLDLAKNLVQLFPEKNLEVIQEKQQKTNEYLASPIQKSRPHIGKIRELGWSPRYSIKEGFKRTIDSFLIN